MKLKVKLGGKTITVEEMPEREQLKILEERKKSWKLGKSRDGFIETWRRKFVHKGVAFELAILRYYDLDDGFKPMLKDRISDRHVVVEYPEETKPLVEKLRRLGIEDFLWHDTLHSWNDRQTVAEQLKEAYNLAVEDIETLPKKLGDVISELAERIRIAGRLKKAFEGRW